MRNTQDTLQRVVLEGVRDNPRYGSFHLLRLDLGPFKVLESGIYKKIPPTLSMELPTISSIYVDEVLSLHAYGARHQMYVQCQAVLGMRAIKNQ